MEAAPSRIRDEIAGAGDFIGWTGGSGLKELRTPGAKQQAVRKMDGLLTVPPMEPGRAVILPFTHVGPTASATWFNKRHS